MKRDIWFDKEAACWEESLPIGGGRLGAMVFGGVSQERIQMNEDGVWYGKPVDRINPDAYANLEKVRSLILGGRPNEAEELLRYAFTATPQSQRIYQPLADCFIRMKGTAETKEYARRLDLNEALVKVDYATSKGKIHREYFSSHNYHVIVVKLEASGKETLDFDVMLSRQKFYDEIVMDEPDSVFLTGSMGKGGLDFAAGCKVWSDGSTKRIGEHLVVRSAKRALLYLTGTSTFYEKDLLAALKEELNRAAAVPYEELKADHISDYRSLFGGVELTLPETEKLEKLTTPERLKRIREGKKDNGLCALYFDFGRYLLISSSRKGGLPANLQGIWNHKMMPDWESKYTININIEMNYWPAESCGLQECMEPVFDMLLRLRESGKRTAQKMYGCRGFMAHHNTDIWADTAPQDEYIPATYWTLGGAWLSLFIWRHYEYCRDAQWLEKYFPILEDAVLFFLDFLVEDHGEYVTCPSVSPENTYIMENGVHACVCAGPALDNELLYDLFTAYAKAAEVLHKEGGMREEVLRYREKLPPMRIGKYGQIMEWREDYDEAEPGHRHVSQLYALYPSSQITVDKTPVLAEAAKKTLERRLHYGGGHTGWSCAWIINMYAQLGMGDEALGMLKHLFKQSTFDNLMDNHPMEPTPVFQIDGNMGGCDAILQMLMQDDGERVRLLPACPTEWTEGEVKGVYLKNNARISLGWTKDMVCGEVEALSDYSGRLVCGKQEERLELKAGEKRKFCFAG